MNSRPKEGTGRREGENLHQGTRHWPGERDDPRGSRESRSEGVKREWEDNAQLPVLLDQRQGSRANRTKTTVADLVGSTPKEKSQRTPQAFTALRAI